MARYISNLTPCPACRGKAGGCEWCRHSRSGYVASDEASGIRKKLRAAGRKEGYLRDSTVR